MAVAAPPTDPLVVVSVGTDHHPFDRLVRFMDRWAAGHAAVPVVIQRGSAAPTAHARSRSLIPWVELRELFASATAVVTHGGPSTVMDVRAAGRLPIVFPRDPDHGEHVDGHQMRFGRHLLDQQLGRIVFDGDELAAVLDEALDDPGRFRVSAVAEPAPGVIGFSRVLDDLLGTATPVAGPLPVAGLRLGSRRRRR